MDESEQQHGTDDRGRDGEERRYRQRPDEPTIPADVSASMLDHQARAGLRGLTKENAEIVGRHLAAAGLIIDEDPERAYQHALAAQRRAGRIATVREAVAITAYETGRYQEALSEARTVRRLSGDNGLRALEADSERGLGRPERALQVVNEALRDKLPRELRAELAIVASGAHSDLGEFEAGLLRIDDELPRATDPALKARLLSVRADRLEDLGRTDEAARIRAALDAAIPEEPAEPDDGLLDIEDVVDMDAPKGKP